MEKRVIFREKDVQHSIQRMAEEIAEKNQPMEDVVLVGIRTGGAFLAKRLQTASNLGMKTIRFARKESQCNFIPDYIINNFKELPQKIKNLF